MIGMIFRRSGNLLTNLVLVGIILFVGCEQQKIQKGLKEGYLVRGMTQEQCVEIVPRPPSSSISTKNEKGHEYVIWFYGDYSKGTINGKLVFKDGKLDSWEESGRGLPYNPRE